MRSRIRSGPDTAFAPPVGVLNAGEELTATGQNNGWWNVTYNGQSAWIAASAVEESGDSCSDLPVVDAPELPASTTSQSNSVSCLNFQHVAPPASGIAQTAVDFEWTGAEGAGSYVLVVYDYQNNEVAHSRQPQRPMLSISGNYRSGERCHGKCVPMRRMNPMPV